MNMIKKVLLSLLSLSLVVTTIMVIFAFNNLVTLEMPSHASSSEEGLRIQYKVAKVDFDDTIFRTFHQGQKIAFTEGSYMYVSIDNVESYNLSLSPIPFLRTRVNEYDMGSDIQFTDGVIVHFDGTVNTFDGGHSYRFTARHYYLDFGAETMFEMLTNSIEYQEYMKANTPSLQAPVKPNVDGLDFYDRLTATFEYTIDHIEWLFGQASFFFNYIAYFIQDLGAYFSFGGVL